MLKARQTGREETQRAALNNTLLALRRKWCGASAENGLGSACRWCGRTAGGEKYYAKWCIWNFALLLRMAIAWLEWFRMEGLNGWTPFFPPRGRIMRHLQGGTDRHFLTVVGYLPLSPPPASLCGVSPDLCSCVIIPAAAAVNVKDTSILQGLPGRRCCLNLCPKKKRWWGGVALIRLSLSLPQLFLTPPWPFCTSSPKKLPLPSSWSNFIHRCPKASSDGRRSFVAAPYAAREFTKIIFLIKM